MRTAAALLLALFPLVAHTQPVKRSELASILNFEAGPSGNQPRGWGGGPMSTIFSDDKTVHSGKWAARLERDGSSPNEFTTITARLPIDFSGPFWSCAVF